MPASKLQKEKSMAVSTAGEGVANIGVNGDVNVAGGAQCLSRLHIGVFSLWRFLLLIFYAASKRQYSIVRNHHRRMPRNRNEEENGCCTYHLFSSLKK